MKALSIRQPWAWLIVQGFKDIENRSWPTKHRGEFLVHASKTFRLKEWSAVEGWLGRNFGAEIILPAPFELERGGIVGKTELIDCVTESDSPWFMGDYGFCLANSEPLPYFKVNGTLNFFDVELPQ